MSKHKKLKSTPPKKLKKQSPTPTQHKTFWNYLKKIGTIASLVLNAFLISLTVLSYIPNISVEPNIWIFDGTKNYAPVTFTNDSFIDVLDIYAMVYLDNLVITCTPYNRLVMGDNTLPMEFSSNKLQKNKPETIFVPIGRVDLVEPIKDVESSDLEIEIRYKLPFINSLPFVPENFHKKCRFRARKYSDISIEWYHY